MTQYIDVKPCQYIYVTNILNIHNIYDCFVTLLVPSLWLLLPTLQGQWQAANHFISQRGQQLGVLGTSENQRWSDDVGTLVNYLMIIVIYRISSSEVSTLIISDDDLELKNGHINDQQSTITSLLPTISWESFCDAQPKLLEPLPEVARSRFVEAA